MPGENQRRRPGTIRDAIHAFMDQCADRTASVSEIQDGVAEVLDGPIAESSIRSYLRLNTPAEFERVARGRYRLR